MARYDLQLAKPYQGFEPSILRGVTPHLCTQVDMQKNGRSRYAALRFEPSELSDGGKIMYYNNVDCESDPQLTLNCAEADSTHSLLSCRFVTETIELMQKQLTQNSPMNLAARWL